MKKILVGLSIIAGLTVSSQAFCDQYGCRQAKITKVYITSDKNVYIGTDGDETQANCSSVSNIYFTIPDVTSEKGKVMFSAILTAQTTNKKIELRTVDGSDGCQIGYIVL